jgi:hypothetical protein
MWYNFIPYLCTFNIYVRPVIGAFFVIDIFVLMGFLMFAAGMGFTHLFYVMDNETTLDDMGSGGNYGSIRLKYSQGVLYNLKHVGFAKLFSWWFPFAHRDKYEGYIWNKIGESREHFAINMNKKMHCVKNGETVDLEDRKEIYIAASMAYQNYTLKYLEESANAPFFDPSKFYPHLKNLAKGKDEQIF